MENDIKKFRIPKSFNLFGHEYNVLMCDDLFNAKGFYGSADDDLKTILIQKAGKVHKHDIDEDEDIYFEITDKTVVETFYHELVHIIFDAIGETKLSENEALVNMVSKAMLEIYLSSKYEKDSEEKEV